MKSILTAFIFLVLSGSYANAQKTTVRIDIRHTTTTSCYVSIPEQTFMYDYLNKAGFNVDLKDHRSASFTVKITKPQFIKLYCHSSTSESSKAIVYTFYLSPGDDLDFKADFDQKDGAISVTGKGSNNNQPLMAALPIVDIHPFYKDTLPYRVVTVLNKDQFDAVNTLKEYNTLYKPSPDFVKAWAINLQYYTCERYFDFKEENKFQIQKAYENNYDQWQHVADSLFLVAMINNDDALGAPYYNELIRYFLLRKKERLWELSYSDSVNFYKQWYGTNVKDGKKLMDADKLNLLQEKIIIKYFTGASAEYLYADLFDVAFSEGYPINIVAIFDRFKEKYPDSKYIEWFNPAIEKIVAKEKQALNKRIVFMTDNGIKFNTLDEVLAKMKGKTALVDMWGTWCGPCREEIEKNSAAIRRHFKNKALTYLYIANDDIDHEQQWKKLIAYFDMEGTHLMANKKLTNDIMAKVKGTGFPTVFIIKKDGSFELSKTEYPIKRDILFKQLEDALAE